MPARCAVSVALCLLGLVLLPHAFAAAAKQPVETMRLDDLGKPEAQLDGAWQFHAGDSPLAAGSSAPLWAQPGFADAGWQQVKADTLDNQNLPYAQFSWYRRHVEITRLAPEQPLAVYVHAVDTYAVYWNGQLLGTMGDVPPRFNWPYITRKAFKLSLPATAQPVSGLLAVRVWCQYPASLQQDCGFLEAPRIGAADLERAQGYVSEVSYFFGESPDSILAVLTLFGAIVAFTIYLRSRRELLYLWFALFLLGSASWQAAYLANLVPDNWRQLFATGTVVLLQGSFVLLLTSLLGLDRDQWLRRVVTTVASVYFLNGAFDALLSLFWAHAGPGMRMADAISSIVQQVGGLAPLAVLGMAIVLRRTKADWLVVLTGLLFALNSSLVNLQDQWPGLFHSMLGGALQRLNRDYYWGFFRFQVETLLLALLLGALSLSIFRRFVTERRRQQQVEQELQSAREIQQVLVPEQVPAIPGYALEAIYRPASEVGGDFFQIFPLEGGGSLVAIGDVSGKGLKAAMIVSLIVGTLRTVAVYTQKPAEILAELNTRLHGRVGGGFVTCLILRVPPDGSIVIANAGHIAPYLNGREWVLGGSLPLGIIPEMEYEESTLALAAGDTLTLMTDGVPEAQNAHKELFGFDRLGGLLAKHPSAAQVVEAACSFGQEDDITVLTLTRLAASAPAHASTLNLTTQLA
jgi:serine phosphatase RsbU (regulator of sigma subunit)